MSRDCVSPQHMVRNPEGARHMTDDQWISLLGLLDDTPAGVVLPRRSGEVVRITTQGSFYSIGKDGRVRKTAQ